MIKNSITLVSILFLLVACSVAKPKDFTYNYSKESNTGLDKRINIDGYYFSQRECDSTFFSVFMFYPDGLFLIATGTDLSEVVKCFEGNQQSAICDYPSWGIYELEGDIVKTQTIGVVGSTSFTVFRDYEIQADGALLNTSEYVHPESTKIGHMRNYPSFRENRCPQKAVFTPLITKRNIEKCPFIKKKWFTR